MPTRRRGGADFQHSPRAQASQKRIALGPLSVARPCLSIDNRSIGAVAAGRLGAGAVRTRCRIGSNPVCNGGSAPSRLLRERRFEQPPCPGTSAASNAVQPSTSELARPAACLNMLPKSRTVFTQFVGQVQAGAR